MRKLPVITAYLASAYWLLAAWPAVGADLPVKAPREGGIFTTYDPYTGFYLGAEIGYGFNLGNVGVAPVDLGTLSAAPQGFLGGVFAGLGTRIHGFLGGLGLDGYIGIEGDGDLGNLTGSAAAPGLLFATNGATGGIVLDPKDTWLASARARFGLIYQNVMFYGTAGWGWGGSTITAVNVVGGTAMSAFQGGTTQSGFTWGGGVEFPWFFGQGWKARFQYLQYDFGQYSVCDGGVVPIGGATPCPGSELGVLVTNKDRIDKITAALSYKF